MVETFLRFMSAFNLATTRKFFSFPWAIYRCETANMKVIKIQPIPSEKVRLRSGISVVAWVAGRLELMG